MNKHYTMTDDREQARRFDTLEEASTFKHGLDDRERLLARVQYVDFETGDAAGYCIHVTRCLTTGREEFVV